MNPSPCGYHNDRTRECRCTQHLIQSYISEISGLLLDRIDIHIDVPAVNYKEMRSGTETESSETIREPVMCARILQQERFPKEGICCNARMAPPQVLIFANSQRTVKSSSNAPCSSKA